MTPKTRMVAVCVFFIVAIALGGAAILWRPSRESKIAVDPKVKEERREAQKKAREQDAAIIQRINKNLKEGGVFILGSRVRESDGVAENVLIPELSSNAEAIVKTIEWSVSAEDYSRLKEGMTLEEVKEVLDLSALRFVPNGPNCRFVLACKQPRGMVTLVFAGNPEVKLVSKKAD